MSRLIDADALINDFQEEIRTANEQTTRIVLSLIMGIIAKQPTAYNVSKVVADIENCMKKHHNLVLFLHRHTLRMW